MIGIHIVLFFSFFRFYGQFYAVFNRCSVFRPRLASVHLRLAGLRRIRRPDSAYSVILVVAPASIVNSLSREAVVRKLYLGRFTTRYLPGCR